MTLAIIFVISVVISIPILILSMILPSHTMGGVEFGSVGSVIAKSAVLIIAADLAWLAPGWFGWVLSLAIWWFGLMLLFRLDFWECRTLVAINWFFNLLVRLGLIAVFASVAA
jgi:hypothetical protein